MVKNMFLLMLLIGVVFVFTACNDNTQVTEDRGNDDEEPFELSAMVEFNGEIPKAEEVIKRMEEYTNTNLDIRWTTGVNDVLPVSMASGDLPDIITFGNSQLRQTYMVNAMEGGVLWDITPYIDEFPNLSNMIEPIIYENISLNGKIYGLPRVRDIARMAFLYRKDWADELGIEEPTTLEEFKEMLEAFKTKADYPMVTWNSGFAEYFALVHGAPNNWRVEDDGSFTWARETPEYMEGLKFLQSLYDEGLINKDYPVMQREEWNNAFINGKAGVYPDVLQAISNQTRMPDAELGIFNQLEGPEGIRVPSANGANGIIAFNKAGLETEEELKKALKFYDQLAEEEMSNLLWYGIEGEHYEVQDGEAERTDHEKYIREVAGLRAQLLSVPAELNAMETDLPALEQKVSEISNSALDYAVHDPSLTIVSKTDNEKGSQLSQKMSDADTAFVLGEVTEEEWYGELEQWKKDGGNKIKEELAEEYEKINQ